MCSVYVVNEYDGSQCVVVVQSAWTIIADVSVIIMWEISGAYLRLLFDSIIIFLLSRVIYQNANAYAAVRQRHFNAC